MDLQGQVLKFLQKEPNRYFTVVEIVAGTCRVKPSEKLLSEHHSKIWQVTGALNTLMEKGAVEGIIMKPLSKEAGVLWQGKFIESPKYAILYQAKKT